MLLCNSKRIIRRIILCVIRSREKNYSFYHSGNTPDFYFFSILVKFAPLMGVPIYIIVLHTKLGDPGGASSYITS